MDEKKFLLTRQSVSPKLMTEPIPCEAEMDFIFQAAMRAPDHGKLQPFRFQVITGDQRHFLGNVFAEALHKRNPEKAKNPELIEKEKEKPLRAPMIIIVSTKLVMNNPKVPPIEQHFTVGCAVQNMLNALHIMGYGGIFLTGKNAYDPYILQALGYSEQHPISGYLYIGSIRDKQSLQNKERPDPHQFMFSTI